MIKHDKKVRIIFLFRFHLTHNTGNNIKKPTNNFKI
jgi:hypothetical protein